MRVGVLYSLTAAVLLAGCLTAPDIDVDEGVPCPCLSGFTCCEALGVCLPDDSLACPAQLTLDSIAPETVEVGGGVEVTLTGSGFADGIRIRVGSADCSDVRLAGDDRLTCRVPPGPASGGAADVIATLPGGATALLEHGLQYERPWLTDRTAQLGIGTFERGRGLTIWDIDDDGDNDLIIARTASEVLEREQPVALNLGGLTFEDVPSELIFETTEVWLPGDFDGDGRDELIGIAGWTPTQSGKSQFVRLEVVGSGRLELEALPVTTTRPSLPALVLPVDHEGDGDLDLVGCHGARFGDELVDVLLFLENDGRGRFTERAEAFSVARREIRSCHAPAATDWDRDGDVDLAICLDVDQLLLLENDGGVFAEAAAQPDSIGRCNTMDFVDVDADGDLDLIAKAATDTQNGVFVWLQDQGRFTPSAPLDLSTDPTCPRRSVDGTALDASHQGIAWLDIDLDGDSDLVTAYPYTHCPRPPLIYENRFLDGERGFTKRLLASSSPLGFATAGVAADLDGDGDLEVAFNAWGYGEVAVLRNERMQAPGPSPRLVRVEAVDAEGAPLVRATIEVDLDGPADAPDFAVGPGKLVARVLGKSGGALAYGPPVAHFAVPDGVESVHVRARRPDGTTLTAVVDEFPADLRLEP